MNDVMLLGRLTKDIELKKSKDTNYANFTLAVDTDGKTDHVDFIRCVVFGNTAVALANNCGKGRQLLVKGTLRISTHNKTSYYSVVANKIIFLHNPKGNKQATNSKDTTGKATENDDEIDVADEDIPF